MLYASITRNSIRKLTCLVAGDVTGAKNHFSLTTACCGLKVQSDAQFCMIRFFLIRQLSSISKFRKSNHYITQLYRRINCFRTAISARVPAVVWLERLQNRVAGSIPMCGSEFVRFRVGKKFVKQIINGVIIKLQFPVRKVL